MNSTVKYENVFRNMSTRAAWELYLALRDVLECDGQRPDPDVVHAFRTAMRISSKADPLARPLSSGWRTNFRPDGIGGDGTDYRILRDRPDRSYTEDEVLEIIRASEVYIGPAYPSPYDCTGQHFTHYIAAHKTPAGWVLLHSWGIDY